jgi:hypothetical protein
MQYSITLGGQGFIVDRRSYRRSLAQPFVPKTASGDRSYQDLASDQVFLQSTFTGDGLTETPAPSPDYFRSSDGTDGFSQPGTLRLGPALATSFPSSEPGFSVLHAFRGRLYAGSDSGRVFQFDGSTWSLAFDTAKTGGIKAMAVYNGKLYVGQGSDGAVFQFDGSAWSTPFTVPSVSGVTALAVFPTSAGVRLYLATTQANGRAEVRYFDGALSGPVFIFNEEAARAAAVLQGRLYFASAQDDAEPRGALVSTDTAATTWRTDDTLIGDSFASAVPCQGALYLGTARQAALYRLQDGRLQPLRSFGPPAAPLQGLAPFDRALWLAIRSPSTASLVRFDPASTSFTTPASTAATPTALPALWPFDRRLYLAERRSNATIWRLDPATLRTSGTLETARFDAGLPTIPKVFRSATASCAPLPSGCAIQLDYRLDDADPWTTLGTISTPGARTATFTFPTATSGTAIAFRLTLSGPGGSSTPALDALACSYLLAPPPKRAWEFAVLLEGTPELPLVTEDGTPEPKTGAQLAADLWTLKAQPGPLPFTDLDGSQYTVWLTDLREETAELSQRRGYQARATLELLEA